MAAVSSYLRFVNKYPNIFLRNRILVNVRYYADDSAKKDDLYETLGIQSSATQAEIKKAYYDLTLKYHPDRNENSDVAATKFREVAEAYEVLGNYSAKKKYDAGVPLPVLKKAVKRTSIEPVTKYQQFFDSRVVQKTSTARNEEFKERNSNPYTKYRDELLRRAEVENHPKNVGVIQNLVAILLVSLMFYKLR